MRNGFFTADLHFNHKNIIKYCSRGAFKNSDAVTGPAPLFNDVDEMNEWLIYMWNLTVKDEDTCYVLGDVAFGNKDEAITLCNRLNGHKVLVYGNHDLKCNDEYWTRAGFEEIHRLGDGTTLPYKEFHLAHYPYRKALLEYDTREYLHGHAPEEQERVLLHGHVHTQWKTKKNMVNVGVDVWNYRPVSIETIRDLLTQDLLLR